MRLGLFILAVLTIAGCSSTTVGPPTSTLTPLPTPQMTTAPPTTLPVPTIDLTGYVGNVTDGRTFDLQVGSQAGYRQVVINLITVPDISTCEGVQARNLLASIIAGHPVRIDSLGIVWKDDIDVANAMVAYGYAKANHTRYVEADMTSVDFSCASTTTTTIQVLTTRPKPKPTTKPTTKPRPKPTTPAPVQTEPAPETEPPNDVTSVT